MELINVFWFRRDLRFNDNTALLQALKQNLPVLPIFIFDTEILNELEEKEDGRVHFIHNQLIKLNLEFRKHGSRLQVFHSTSLSVFTEIMQKFTVEAVYASRDYEPAAKNRDHKVRKYLLSQNTELVTFKDQVIFEDREILTDQGNPYQVFTPYKNKWIQHFTKELTVHQNSEAYLSNLLRDEFREIPSLSSIGFKPTRFLFSNPVIDIEVLKNYHEKRDYPSAHGTSRIGIHLRHGTISIRQAVREAMKFSPVWLNELIWREFYMMILSNFPHVVDHSFKKTYDVIPWRNNELEFEHWCKGKTGYPIVDAGMRELNETGYMHNRVRMITASFLTKHLLIDWRWGEGYFAQKLLDFELSSNNGGWQWAAGTGTDAQPYFRVFNPYAQALKFDPNFTYIKKWVPEFGMFEYPSPMVDHAFARQRAIQVYKDALSGSN